MKHQYWDYIKWIDEEIVKASYTADSEPDSSFLLYQSDIDRAKRFRASLLANKATLERFKPKAHLIPCPDGIMGCSVVHWSQPVISPPLLDVTNQLDEVMG